MKSHSSDKHQALARHQLGQAVRGVLSGLLAVEAHFGPSAWLSSLARSGSGATAQAERLREVLDRDRAIAVAGPPLLAAERPKAAAPRAPTAARARSSSSSEPIRTRTMARLLAGQGHHARALAIYDDLLATSDSDPSLRAEAELLRMRAQEIEPSHGAAPPQPESGASESSAS